jgi:nucleoside-diphosphate-sugar epimerase
MLNALRKMPIPVPALAPDIPVQFIHEDDVGQAFQHCIVGDGPPGAYNIAADGVMTGADVLRELGMTPVSVPGGIVHAAAGAIASLPNIPGMPPMADWVEAASHPAIMDTTKAKTKLGWKPKYDAAEALRATLPS